MLYTDSLGVDLRPDCPITYLPHLSTDFDQISLLSGAGITSIWKLALLPANKEVPKDYYEVVI